MEKIFLFGIGITNAKKDEVLEYILQSLKKTYEKYFIVTPNPEILVYATKHNEFKKIVNQARLALCDGIGVIWGGKILGKNFKERITGVDFIESLCKEVSKKPITVGFLGGRDKVAELTAECLLSRYPGLKIAFVGEEWGQEGFIKAKKYQVASSKYYGKKKNQESLTANHMLPTIDILFVAYGFPKQEEWMHKYINTLPVRIAVGVGGSFDYLSGVVPRAPKFLQSLGIEWLFRLVVQPWRIKRQLSLLEFIYLVLRERFSL